MSTTDSTETETVDYDERTEGPPQRLEEAPPEAEASTDAPEDAGDDQEGAEDEPAGREAARYRRRLRAAEAERDTLAETVDAMRRAEVERLAAADVANPAAIWAAGVELGNLLGEDGTPDPAKVHAATAEAAKRLGLARPRPANHVPREGNNPVSRGHGGMVDAVMGR